MKRFAFFLFLWVACLQLKAQEVLVIIRTYNRPDFIQYQYKALKKFLKEACTIIVYNDAPSSELHEAIDKACKDFNIECIAVPSSIHSQSFPKRYLGEPLTLETRGIQTLQYALAHKAFDYNGPVLLIDSDVFPVKCFSIQSMLKGAHFAAAPEMEKNIRYIWSGLVAIDMPKCPDKIGINFFPGRIGNVVVGAGGFMHTYFTNHLTISINSIDRILSINFDLCTTCDKSLGICSHDQYYFKECGFDDNQIDFLAKHPRNIEFLYNNSFLHYRGSSNWDIKSQEYIAQKTALIFAYLEKILID